MTNQELKIRIEEQDALIEKMRFQLQRALESMLELIAEVNRLKGKYEP